VAAEEAVAAAEEALAAGPFSQLHEKKKKISANHR
jgi:hypothetical protein